MRFDRVMSAFASSLAKFQKLQKVMISLLLNFCNENVCRLLKRLRGMQYRRPGPRHLDRYVKTDFIPVTMVTAYDLDCIRWWIW